MKREASGLDPEAVHDALDILPRLKPGDSSAFTRRRMSTVATPDTQRRRRQFLHDRKFGAETSPFRSGRMLRSVSVMKDSGLQTCVSGTETRQYNFESTASVPIRMLGGIQSKELALLVWLVATFAVGTVVYSPLNGLALSVPTTWGLWALLMLRERE
ncbi:hypothetical protein [Halorubrum ezzemoulense]|uniref:hypothetical protein n=1 Tax=Halorubrum ezzemoulense TaxID=337243 RepID=UPI00232C8390|nr:hypothetical protein [Halorubrum ezzemoulense]MDB9254006.1 hypothetical protein [Halorubrum ezzemoulense]MDB9257288.1 hypothetical protein [Halorubrum ezzemoulense]MDB9278238.1 hypothetical protein [Halorubrum ezzemoulense]